MLTFEVMTDEQKFAAGYDHGYILEEYEPELLKAALKTPNNHSDYFQGLRWGQKQMIQDRFIEQMRKNELENDLDLSLE